MMHVPKQSFPVNPTPNKFLYLNIIKNKLTSDTPDNTIRFVASA